MINISAEQRGGQDDLQGEPLVILISWGYSTSRLMCVLLLYTREVSDGRCYECRLHWQDSVPARGVFRWDRSP